MALLEPIFALAGGLLGLLLGSHLAVGGSLHLAHKWGWPSWVAGILLLALGTSLPELFVTIRASAAHPGFALSTVMGSNAFNVGIVLGLLLLIAGDSKLAGGKIRWLLLSILLLASLVAGRTFPESDIPLWLGPLFLAGYAGVIILSVLSGKAERAASSGKDAIAAPSTSEESMAWAWVRTLGGFTLLAVAAHFFLHGSLDLASRIGWTEGLAGFLIAAVGTSAPELFTCWQTLRKGLPEAVYGNVLGSNLFNLLCAGGLVGILASRPIEQGSMAGPLEVNALAALALLVLPFLLLPAKKPLTRAIGALLLLGYFLAAGRALSG